MMLLLYTLHSVMKQVSSLFVFIKKYSLGLFPLGIHKIIPSFCLKDISLYQNDHLLLSLLDCVIASSCKSFGACTFSIHKEIDNLVSSKFEIVVVLIFYLCKCNYCYELGVGYVLMSSLYFLYFILCCKILLHYSFSH